VELKDRFQREQDGKIVVHQKDAPFHMHLRKKWRCSLQQSVHEHPADAGATPLI
jgi:hypothetical protein